MNENEINGLPFELLLTQIELEMKMRKKIEREKICPL